MEPPLTSLWGSMRGEVSREHGQVLPFSPRAPLSITSLTSSLSPLLQHVWPLISEVRSVKSNPKRFPALAVEEAVGESRNLEGLASQRVQGVHISDPQNLLGLLTYFCGEQCCSCSISESLEVKREQQL